jgi:hypothetical protein
MEMVEKRLLRTGDGSHSIAKAHGTVETFTDESVRDVEHFWGWEDETLTAEDKEGFTIYHRTQD